MRSQRGERTHFCSLTESPAVSGSTNASKVLASDGSFFQREGGLRQAVALFPMVDQ
jgi:hypothetical protein